MQKNLARIRKQVRRIVIDECSMLDPKVFEMLVRECQKADLGIVLVGDFFQLPPVNANGWLFSSPSWSKFKDNVINLNTQYRQTDTTFLEGLNLLRVGSGSECLPHLEQSGVTFQTAGSNSFAGVTLTGTNKWKDKINAAEYAQLAGSEFVYMTERSGYGPSEWNKIPNESRLKVGARVMVLRNLYGYKFGSDEAKKVDTDTLDKQSVMWEADGSVGITKYAKGAEYVLLQSNGDTGVVESIDAVGGQILSVDVRRDDGSLIRVLPLESDNGKWHTEIGQDGRRHRICDKEASGWIKYLPLATAWAITIHKAQGLTLSCPTRVICEDYCKSPAMMYVACSRVKNPKHLTLLLPQDQSTEQSMKKLCKASYQVSTWAAAA
jgi:ATP-dependent DNA helicase PIF1